MYVRQVISVGEKTIGVFLNHADTNIPGVNGMKLPKPASSFAVELAN